MTFILISCGGTNTSSPPVVLVSIAPGSVTVLQGGVQIFTASVSGSSNEAVSWSVQEGAVGGTTCGGL